MTRIAARQSWIGRALGLSMVRIVSAVFVTAIAGGLTQAAVQSVADQRFHFVWPELCGALAALAAYALYVRWLERRVATELSGQGAASELAVGLSAGAAMVFVIVGVLTVFGIYRFHGVNTPGADAGRGFAEMVFVGVLEELLSRAIVFRLIERSFGTAAALAISCALFGLAHVPGEAAGLLSVAIAVVAGVFFAAAFMLTRRLWLSIGLHVGWNFTLGFAFSIAVSGHPGKGFIFGELSGPSWLTGGAYGLEASVLTLLTLLLVGGWLLQGAARRGHWVSWRAVRSAQAKTTDAAAERTMPG